MFDDETQGKNGRHYPSHSWGGDEGEYLLTEELDHDILMHREAHFGGSFASMLEYYQADKMGTDPDFDIERIGYLAQVEEEVGQNLAPLILSTEEAERIARARKAYRDLKAIYEIDNPQSPIPRLLADLILSEEEDPVEEIDAIVREGKKMVPELLRLLTAPDAYDSLFPGYGYAPYLAILCLGKIQDPKAIVPLFEAIGKQSIFGDEPILEALLAIGPPALSFLLKTLASRPLTHDNQTAAYALSAFPPSTELAIAAFKALEDFSVRQDPLLASYLLCHIDPLEKTPHKQAFLTLSTDPSLPKEIKEEMAHIRKRWSV